MSSPRTGPSPPRRARPPDQQPHHREDEDRLRAVYADDAATLLQVAHIVAAEFATIAAANDHWRHTEDQ
ncbi:hypothetical protein PSU4_48360 [Pseudonocardia sulfidoxydans NBRC 16205]|uniref:Hexameric tyrosine-coordinated heme protein (HTHP) n=1 Tax=Pseudonocardia sulfidoxydans NBRC 16205 TaxID=1223511 RepID=A0A511DM43_9PSEU|nr:hexameric tyrosine-coordinated heme protein [Pseudonocardia sulfidoxydans]GEL25882.1 hypothetical protein PSU4_48360 [Pseudonocardia sulfidoxydans NBRC 16205]